MSSDHDYAEDEYFLKYAYIAVNFLLEDIDQHNRSITPQEFKLNDYVDTGKCILVIDKENANSIGSFNILDYTVDLFKYGYEYNGSGNFNPATIEAGRKRLSIRPLSKHLRGDSQINIFFKDYFLMASNEVIKFHICYQIIELLIVKVLDFELKDLVKGFDVSDKDAFSLSEELQNLMKESKRIKLLCTNFTVCDAEDKREIQKACQKFLEQNNKRSKENYYENLYMVRCLLVHKLYSLDDKSFRYLARINQFFLNIVIEMLITFDFKR